VEIGVDDNIFGVPDAVQKFFNMGFLGATVTTILGSIAWQLVASAFPIAFLSNPLVYVFLRAALLLESTGICAGAWFLGIVHKKVAGFEIDEVHIGTPEERAARDKADRGRSLIEPHLGTNVLSLPPGARELPEEWKSQHFQVGISFSQRRAQILNNIKELREQTKVAETADEKLVFECALRMEISALEKLNSEQEHNEADVELKGNMTVNQEAMSNRVEVNV